MPGYAWVIIIFIGLCVLAFVWNYLLFLWEFICAIGKTAKGEKPPGDYSDPHWTGKL